jgi:hypothetical protein
MPVPGVFNNFNPLNTELNPICYLLALLAHHFLHISRIRVKSLTLRLLMSYIYMEHLFLMFLDHTWSRQVSGRRPLTCWDRGFESHQGHGYLSVVCVMCCQAEVSATSWSLVQRSPTDCGASLCVIQKHQEWVLHIWHIWHYIYMTLVT